jgi:hypothetical protein
MGVFHSAGQHRSFRDGTMLKHQDVVAGFRQCRRSQRYRPTYLLPEANLLRHIKRMGERDEQQPLWEDRPESGNRHDVIYLK